MTKKGRTILTAFAGSIGIIGIALILSLSSGMQDYINKMEEDTLTSYPITIQEATMDMSSMMGTMMSVNSKGEEHEPGQVYSSSVMTDIIDSMMSKISTNDLSSFKKVLEEDGNELPHWPRRSAIPIPRRSGSIQKIHRGSSIGSILFRCWMRSVWEILRHRWA